MGLVYRKMKNYNKAIDCYTTELCFDEANIRALINRAYCYAKINNFLEAIKDYSAVLKFDMKNIHALHNRGICFQRINNFDRVSGVSLNRIGHQGFYQDD
jgi:tetratricopeptide (TPR) repeat protein